MCTSLGMPLTTPSIAPTFVLWLCSSYVALHSGNTISIANCFVHLQLEYSLLFPLREQSDLGRCMRLLQIGSFALSAEGHQFSSDNQGYQYICSNYSFPLLHGLQTLKQGIKSSPSLKWRAYTCICVLTGYCRRTNYTNSVAVLNASSLWYCWLQLGHNLHGLTNSTIPCEILKSVTTLPYFYGPMGPLYRAGPKPALQLCYNRQPEL